MRIQVLRAVAAGLAFAIVGVIAACGGDDGADLPDEVVLAGTVIPPATPTVTPVPQCDPPGGALPLPANFPPDVPVPPGFVVWSTSTEPHLNVLGRMSPPPSPDPPGQVLGIAMVDNLQQFGWTVTQNPNVPGSDYNFRMDDGREGHISSVTVPQCAGQAALGYDLYWLTP